MIKLTEQTKPNTADSLWAEARLAEHWTRRCKKSVWAGERSPVVRRGVAEGTVPQDMSGTELEELFSRIAGRIATGYPLTAREYHLAIACALLITDLPYETFFKTRWHENNDHLAYGPGGVKNCTECRILAKEKRQGVNRGKA